MIAFIMGTRSEIIKLAPVIEQARKRHWEYKVYLSGQHYDVALVDQFLQLFEIDRVVRIPPVFNFSDAHRLAIIMAKLSWYMAAAKPSVVVVQGGTNTALAGALIARKMNAVLAHVEAGLRSWDWRQPEEHNRRVIDAISDINFAPTMRALQNLKDENIYSRSVCIVTGNTVVDVVKGLNIPEEPRWRDSVFLTLHRAETVDYIDRLKAVIDGLIETGERFIFPVHPRTKRLLRYFELPERFKILEPLGYLESLSLVKSCKFVATDSGSLVEEATTLGKRVVILRDFNDRPEAEESGHAVLAGTTKEGIVDAFRRVQHLRPRGFNPFGDGNASEIIADFLEQPE